MRDGIAGLGDRPRCTVVVLRVVLDVVETVGQMFDVGDGAKAL